MERFKELIPEMYAVGLAPDNLLKIKEGAFCDHKLSFTGFAITDVMYDITNVLAATYYPSPQAAFSKIKEMRDHKDDIHFQGGDIIKEILDGKGIDLDKLQVYKMNPMPVSFDETAKEAFECTLQDFCMKHHNCSDCFEAGSCTGDCDARATLGSIFDVSDDLSAFSSEMYDDDETNRDFIKAARKYGYNAEKMETEDGIPYLRFIRKF